MPKMLIKFAAVMFLFFLIAGCGSSGNNKKLSGKDNQMSSVQFGGNPEFEVTEHNFGVIASGEEVGARFGFKNTGDEPLLIDRVATGCGCTVAQYSEKPLKPGDSGFVEIVFDSRGKYGSQFQEARVFFRGLKKPSRLSIFAEVDKK